MEGRKYLKNLYDDFFGISRLTQEQAKIAEELNLTDDIPVIEVKPKNILKSDVELAKEEEAKTEQEIKRIKDKQMAKFFDVIDNMLITDESKNLLKKMIEYMRKFHEKIETQYIPFDMCIYSKNDETIQEVINVISDAAIFFSYVRQGSAVEVNLYNIERIEQLEDIYDITHSIVVLNGLDGMVAKEETFRDKFWNNLEEKIESKEKQALTIMVAKNKETVELAIGKNTKIKDIVFDYVIEELKPDIQDVFETVIEKLEEKNFLSDEVKLKLLNYITATYPGSELSYPDYRDSLCQKILFSKGDEITEKDIPDYEEEKTLDEVFAELNELVGLKKVKEVLHELVDLIELKKKSSGNLKIKDTNLHMVFLGNPGTGKTTVARIIAKILYNLKYIKQNKLIEVSSKDLVAEYVGQTAPKTNAVIEKALGGVLFIDEAYTLASGAGQGGSAYNEEAIATLIQGMENHRDNLVVIFAGYTKEMQAFLNANSGIVSRIGYTLEFEDYTEEELLQIFEGMMKKSGFVVTKEAQDEVIRVIKEYKDTRNFGNARFARNLYEKSIIKHASNTKNDKSKKALCTITKEDISTENLLKM